VLQQPATADDDDKNEIDLDNSEAAADVVDMDAIDLEDALEDEQAVESQNKAVRHWM
jgi:hypothetical protein